MGTASTGDGTWHRGRMMAGNDWRLGGEGHQPSRACGCPAGSKASRRHPMASHRHQLCSSSVFPRVRRRRSSPQPQQRSGRTSTSPSDPTQEDRQAADSCGAIWARVKHLRVVHRGKIVGPRSSATEKRGPLGASVGAGLPAPRRPPNPRTKTKSWREPDRVRAISQPALPPLQSNEPLW